MKKQPMRKISLVLIFLSAFFLALMPAPATAQDLGEFFWGGGDEALFSSNNVPYDGSFVFLRMRFTPSSHRGRGGGYFDGINYQWDHDYPRAEQNFLQIMSELTDVDADPGKHNILSVGDPEIFKYPFGFIVEPGYLTLTGDEAANLRAYLLKGGFLVFDDFAGDWQLGTFLDQMRKVLPEVRPVMLDPSHPIFSAFFEIDSLEFYHPYRGVPSRFIGYYEDNDPSKRLMAVANYNNDIMESWEFSDTGFISIELSNVAYQLGVNYVIYSMTH